MPAERPGRPVVLVLVKGLGIGGAEKLISEGARHWDRTSFDYRVAYLLPWKDQLVTDLETLDVPVVSLSGRRGLTPRTVRRLRRICGWWNVDLIHAHLPSAGILARTCTRLPVVYTEHNLVDAYRLPTRVGNRLTYGRNTAVTAVSQAVADSVSGYPGPSAEVVPNGVAVSVTDDAPGRARAELGLGADDPLIVHVGNIRPGKGHELLVAVAARLVERRPDVTVVSIGGEKHAGDLERMRTMVSQRGLDGQIRFLGRRPDAIEFIAAADVYLNPADVEGLPVTILEAMALGRAVVATSVGGVPAVIEHGLTGVLVPPRAPEATARAVLDVLADPDAARRLGEAASGVVAAGYGLSAMVERFESLYRRVLG